MLLYKKYIILIVIVLVIHISYSQEIDIDGDIGIAQNTNIVYEDTSLRVLLGLSYKYINWSYRIQELVQANQLSGATKSMYQYSYGQSLPLNTVVMLKPSTGWSNIHLLIATDIYFPLSMEETVSPIVNNNKNQVVQTTVNYLVTGTSGQTLKGLGFEWLFGITYSIPQESIVFIIGTGFATNVFIENLNDTTPRGMWGLGAGLQAAIQFRFMRYFGLQVGVKGTYYPITFIDVRNIISASFSDALGDKVKYKINTVNFINS